jgi:hypothetical protein
MALVKFFRAVSTLTVEFRGPEILCGDTNMRLLPIDQFSGDRTKCSSSLLLKSAIEYDTRFVYTTSDSYYYLTRIRLYVIFAFPSRSSKRTFLKGLPVQHSLRISCLSQSEPHMQPATELLIM